MKGPSTKAFFLKHSNLAIALEKQIWANLGHASFKSLSNSGMNGIVVISMVYIIVIWNNIKQLTKANPMSFF